MADPLAFLTATVMPAATARFVLLANHVLQAAPAATERLRAHAGRLVQVDVEGWRLPLLPQPPSLWLRITPAGMFEQPGPDEPGAAPDLRLGVDASQPLDSARRLAAGEVPAVRIEGDAALAADMSWLLAHVRWDPAADLERVFGPMVAEGFSRAGGTAMAAVRQVVQSVSGVVRRP
ncbi:hypothetical protein [Ideonella livida]|uniref:Ubiquinone biosynthesis protein UbiJ n=1 Tax=Ideonella livida TaxID=2707176 RepID=A0A7C9PF26_9BURK|nr:hypothetical protein [Ideonella livida]NDY89991.1 hypothetical protein [Ideonella livida]